MCLNDSGFILSSIEGDVLVNARGNLLIIGNGIILKVDTKLK